MQRHRDNQLAAQEDPRWRQAQALAIAESHPDRSQGVAHACSLGYANEALAEYDLDDWDWLVADLANEMDDAAFGAAEEWLALHRPALENAAHLPRWCPCGRWPDFGVGCHYHGACKCVTAKIGSADLMTVFYVDYRLAYGDIAWRHMYDGRTPVLDRGCPVHPDGPMPPEVYARWQVHGGLSLTPTAAEQAQYEKYHQAVTA